MKHKKDNSFLPITSVNLIPDVSKNSNRDFDTDDLDHADSEIDDDFLNNLLEQLKHNGILKVVDLREESLNFRLLGEFESMVNTYYAPVLDNSDNKIKMVVAGSKEVYHIEKVIQKEMLKINNILSNFYYDHFTNYDLNFRLNDIPHISKRSHGLINFKFPKEYLRASLFYDEHGDVARLTLEFLIINDEKNI